MNGAPQDSANERDSANVTCQAWEKILVKYYNPMFKNRQRTTQKWQLLRYDMRYFLPVDVVPSRFCFQPKLRERERGLCQRIRGLIVLITES